MAYADSSRIANLAALNGVITLTHDETLLGGLHITSATVMVAPFWM